MSPWATRASPAHTEMFKVIFSSCPPSQWAENVAREVFGANGEGKGKKNSTSVWGGGRRGKWGHLLINKDRNVTERSNLRAKLLFKYSVYSNYEIQYKNREIYRVLPVEA